MSRELEILAKRFKLKFIRMFGSYIKDPIKARDVDILIDRKLNIAQISELVNYFEKHFKRPVDLVSMSPSMSLILAREIAKASKPIWEDAKTGRADYAVKMDRLLALAEDAKIAFTDDMRKEALRLKNKRLVHKKPANKSRRVS